MINLNEHKFEDIIERNKSRIFRICSSYAVSPIEPQDLFQEVVVQIWKSILTFQGRSDISTWVYRIALNVCINSNKKLKSKQFKTVQLDSIEFIPSEGEMSKPDQERLDALQSCLSKMNGIEKSIVVLFLEDLPYKEIAEITGLTANHIAVKMKRIKKSLLKCITSKNY